MSSHLNLALDPQLADIQAIFSRKGLLSQPGGSPADEISGKDHQIFLQINGRFSPNLDPVELKDLFSFLNAGFNELSAIVVLKPGRSILGHRVSAKMQ